MQLHIFHFFKIKLRFSFASVFHWFAGTTKETDSLFKSVNILGIWPEKFAFSVKSLDEVVCRGGRSIVYRLLKFGNEGIKDGGWRRVPEKRGVKKIPAL